MKNLILKTQKFLIFLDNTYQIVLLQYRQVTVVIVRVRGLIVMFQKRVQQLKLKIKILNQKQIIKESLRARVHILLRLVLANQSSNKRFRTLKTQIILLKNKYSFAFNLR